jgi:hypothetical protein
MGFAPVHFARVTLNLPSALLSNGNAECNYRAE